MGVENIKIVLDEGKIPNEGYLILGGCSFNLYLSGVHINKTNKTKQYFAPPELDSLRRRCTTPGAWGILGGIAK